MLKIILIMVIAALTGAASKVSDVDGEKSDAALETSRASGKNRHWIHIMHILVLYLCTFY